jgi:hypothetical protein
MQAILDRGLINEDDEEMVVEDLEDDFITSKNYDFRFSRESLCDMKRGT